MQNEVTLCSQHFKNESIYNLDLCVLLFKDTLCNMYCWFVNIELTLNSTITHTWGKLIQCTFSLWDASQFSCAWKHQITLQDSAWSHFKQWNHQQKAQKCKKSALNIPWKGHLFIVWEMKQEGKTSPCSASAGNIRIRLFKFFATLHRSTNDSSKVMIWGLQINFSE